ncbi:MAG: YdcF family protein [Sphingomonadaceae bacterium]
MIRRILSLIVTVWLLGWAGFVVSLPRAADDTRTDAIVVLTGGAGRIQRGLDHLALGHARRMLVSGVDPSVRLDELAQLQKAPPKLFACCVDLGKDAIDTRSNAAEAARWLRHRHFRSVRLVTTDWHMPRAQFELERAVGPDVHVVPDAVDSAPGFVTLFAEYNKYLLRRVSALAGV